MEKLQYSMHMVSIIFYVEVRPDLHTNGDCSTVSAGVTGRGGCIDVAVRVHIGRQEFKYVH